MKLQSHPFHLVDSSPWPLATSLALLITTIGGAAKIHGYSGITLTIGIITLLTCIFLWWKDVITESITLKCFPVIKITVYIFIFTICWKLLIFDKILEAIIYQKK